MMKETILTAAFIYGLMIPAFTQLNGDLKIDTNFRKWSIYDYQRPFNLAIEKHYKSQKLGSFDNNLLLKNFRPKRLNFNQDSIKTIVKPQSYNNMPCIKPQGYFAMKVYKPDSTVKYFMRIEKIKSKRQLPTRRVHHDDKNAASIL